MSNLASIGFEVPDYTSFQNLAERVFYEGRSIRLGNGYYVYHRDESGAELWVQVDKEQSIIGMNPHFQTESQLEVTLLEAVSRKESPLDGGFRASTGPNRDQQIVFDLPDAHRHEGLALPHVTKIGLAGFASALEAAAPDAPSGFHPLGGSGESPDAHYRVTGTVLDSAFKINGWTGRAYLWLALDLGFGQMEMVTMSRAWKGLPPKGTHLHADAWLSGQVGLEKQSKSYKGFLERLFSGS